MYSVPGQPKWETHKSLLHSVVELDGFVSSMQQRIATSSYIIQNEAIRRVRHNSLVDGHGNLPSKQDIFCSCANNG